MIFSKNRMWEMIRTIVDEIRQVDVDPLRREIQTLAQEIECLKGNHHKIVSRSPYQENKVVCKNCNKSLASIVPLANEGAL